MTLTSGRPAIQSVEEFARTIGITVCPPRYAAPTIQGALHGEEAKKRIKALKLPEEPRKFGSLTFVPKP